MLGRKDCTVYSGVIQHQKKIHLCAYLRFRLEVAENGGEERGADVEACPRRIFARGIYSVGEENEDEVA